MFALRQRCLKLYDSFDSSHFPKLLPYETWFRYDYHYEFQTHSFLLHCIIIPTSCAQLWFTLLRLLSCRHVSIWRPSDELISHFSTPIALSKTTCLQTFLYCNTIYPKWTVWKEQLNCIFWRKTKWRGTYVDFVDPGLLGAVTFKSQNTYASGKFHNLF